MLIYIKKKTGQTGYESGFVVTTRGKKGKSNGRSAIDMLFSKVQITVRIMKFISNKRPLKIFITGRTR